jgi:hypothetical protein
VHRKGRPANNTRNMAADNMPTQTDHVSLEILWEYHLEKIALAFEQITHLCTCDDCLATLGLCQIAKTLKQAERMNQERLEKIRDPKNGV